MASKYVEELHRRICAARDRERRSQHQLARLLHQLEQCEGYRELGYTSMAEYGAVEQDMKPRRTRDLLRIGRCLTDLPTLDEVFGRGKLDWTKVREVSRVASPETDAAWTERALELNSRQLEAMVSAAVAGEAPASVGEIPKEPARKRIVWNADAADAQVIQDALALAAQDCAEEAGQVDQAVLLAAICRGYIERREAQEAPSGTRYRILVQSCDRCQQQTGPIHELTEEVCGEAACDSEVVDLRPGPEQGRLQRTVPPTIRRTVLHRQGGGCAVPGCRNRLWVDVHHVVPRCQGGRHAPENLVALCTAHHRLVHSGNLAIEWAEPGLLEVRRASGHRSHRRLWSEPGAILAPPEAPDAPPGSARGLSSHAPRGSAGGSSSHAPRGSAGGSSSHAPHGSAGGLSSHAPRGSAGGLSSHAPRGSAGVSSSHAPRGSAASAPRMDESRRAAG